MATTLPARARGSRRLRAHHAVHRPWWYLPAIVTGDVLAGALGLLAVLIVAPSRDVAPALPLLLLIAVSWPLMLAARGVYKARYLGTREERNRAVRTLVELIALVAVATVIFNLPVPHAAVVAAIPVALFVSLVNRYAGGRILTQLRRHGYAVRRVLAVGTGPGVTSFIDRLSVNVAHDMVVVGACAEGAGRVVEDIPVIARMPDPRTGDAAIGDEDAVQMVMAAARQVGADTICITGCSLFGGDKLRALSWAAAAGGISLVVTTGLDEVSLRRMQFGRAGNAVLVHVHPVRVAGLAGFAKDVFDRVAAALGLVILLPAMLAIALAVKVSDGGPALYPSQRLGRAGQPFTMLKFRTMVPDAETQRSELEQSNEHDGHMFKVRNDPRITRIGRFLRRTSLDELPQLVNVLLGQMSLVGPRPPLPDEVSDYTAVELRRLLVRPGMTGLWQVSGRSNLSWDETVRLDLRYIDNWSFGTDAALLWRTTRAVTKGTGAY